MQINHDFFQKFKILDGGVGQELLARGVKPVSNLWSTTALLKKEYHNILLDCHLDFINAGAEIILTNTFGSRRRRLEENNLLSEFENLNLTALKIAEEAVKKSGKKIIIAGSLPPQNFTYISDLGDDKKLIEKNFHDQAKILHNGVDLFYLDVMSSLEECEIAIQSIKEFNKPFIIGIHFKKNGLLPSGEMFIDVVKKLNRYNPLAITGSCVSYEDIISIKNDFKNLSLPFGFKVNAFANIPEGWKIKPGNPTESLGVDQSFNSESFISFAEKCRLEGASILGGCCEVLPSHIKALAEFYEN